MTDDRESRGAGGFTAALRAEWRRQRRRYAREYWRYFELRALGFLAAVAAIGYTVADTPGLTTADAITDAVGLWAIGMAIFFAPPGERDDD